MPRADKPHTSAAAALPDPLCVVSEPRSTSRGRVHDVGDTLFRVGELFFHYRDFAVTGMKTALITNKTIVFCLSLDYNAIRKNTLIMMRQNYSDIFRNYEKRTFTAETDG